MAAASISGVNAGFLRRLRMVLNAASALRNLHSKADITAPKFQGSTASRRQAVAKLSGRSSLRKSRLSAHSIDAALRFHKMFRVA